MLKSIIRKLIFKELKKIMQTWIQPILDFLYKLADKYGTKFVVGLGGVGGIVYLQYFDKLDWISAGAITVIVTGYYFARHVQEINKTSTNDK